MSTNKPDNITQMRAYGVQVYERDGERFYLDPVSGEERKWMGHRNRVTPEQLEIIMEACKGASIREL